MYHIYLKDSTKDAWRSTNTYVNLTRSGLNLYLLPNSLRAARYFSCSGDTLLKRITQSRFRVRALPGGQRESKTLWLESRGSCRNWWASITP